MAADETVLMDITVQHFSLCTQFRLR